MRYALLLLGLLFCAGVAYWIEREEGVHRVVILDVPPLAETAGVEAEELRDETAGQREVAAKPESTDSGGSSDQGEIDQGLADGRYVKIRVVDAEGEPVAGYPCKQCLRIGSGSKTQYFDLYKQDLKTDSRGVFRWKVDGLEQRMGSTASSTPVFCFGIGVGQPRYTTPPIVGPDGEPTDVILPPAGTLHVQILDGQGSAFLGKIFCQTRVGGRQGAGSSAGGEATVLSQIPLGEKFDLYVSAGDEWMSVDLPCEALTMKERVRQVTVIIDERPPLYMGRLLGSDGAPVAEKRVLLDLQLGYRRPTQYLATTDSEGRFQFYREGPVPKRISALVALLGFHHDHKGEAQVRATETLGVYDFGDITMVKQPVIMAGRVLLPDGTPASWLGLEWVPKPGLSRDESEATALRKFNQKMKMEADPGQLKALGYKRSGRVGTAKDGTFRVLGTLSNQTILLGTEGQLGRYSDNYLLPRDVSVLSGKEDLELTLIKAAQIKVTLANGSNRELKAVVEYPDGLRFKLVRTFGPEREMIHNSLFPGYVDLTVFDAKSGQPVASISSLLLVPGEQTDARLRGIVLE